MVTFDCEWTRADGVTLVTARLRGVEEPTRVTVRNALDGPVWPPRREGVPVAGWDDTGFSAVLDPGDHALGYASPAEPSDPPARLVDTTPMPEGTDGLSSDHDVVRELGDPSPPADAVPVTDDPGVDPTATAGRPTESPLPTAVADWLANVEDRVERAEQLADAESLPAATEAVRSAGSLDEVRTLAERGDRDVRTLRRLAARAESLADRREAAGIPVETLARLA